MKWLTGGLLRVGGEAHTPNCISQRMVGQMGKQIHVKWRFSHVEGYKCQRGKKTANSETRKVIQWLSTK